MIGKPTLLANGNFAVDCQLVVENNGAFDLADVRVAQDLETQLGPGVLQNVSGLTLSAPPTNVNSSIALNELGWDGTSATDLIDQSVSTNRLASGDSFVIGFTLEFDASLETGVLNSSATATGTAVDSRGTRLTDAASNVINASDASDSKTNPKDANSSDPSDIGRLDQPPIYIPFIGVAKTASDAVANGDNWDVTFTIAWKNTGTVALDNVQVFDDIAAGFGGQFAGATINRVTPGAGNAGPSPVANTSWNVDTAQSLVTSTGPLEVGDTCEVVFTVTIDPNAVGTAARGLESRAFVSGEALKENGVAITNPDGSPVVIRNDSDNSSDPAPIVIADVSVAKAIAGSPTQLANGSFEVVYELVMANTGTVDLAKLTLVEDLAKHFGSALVSAGKIALTSAPAVSRSSVVLNSGWSGNGATEMIDQTASTLLAVGDSFTVAFAVEVDPLAASAIGDLENLVAVGVEVVEAEAVGARAAGVSDASHIEATDLSDSEIDPNSDEPTVQVDQATSDDPKQPTRADLTITKAIVEQPVVTDRGNYVVTYQLVIENTGNVDLANLSLLEDISARFGPPLVKAGNLTITSGPSDVGSSVSVDSAGWNGKISTELLDSSAANVLVTNDAFTIQFEVEINPRRVISPLENQEHPTGLAANHAPMGNLIDGFIGAPGPIFSGVPIDQNSTPFGLDGGTAVPSRYSVGDGSIIAAV